MSRPSHFTADAVQVPLTKGAEGGERTKAPEATVRGTKDNAWGRADTEEPRRPSATLKGTATALTASELLPSPVSLWPNFSTTCRQA